jgi:hypothetical protein
MKVNKQNKAIGCEIDCGGKTAWFPCLGTFTCLCHQYGITLGDPDGCCSNCGCPKTTEEFNRICSNSELRESHRRTFISMGGDEREWSIEDKS